MFGRRQPIRIPLGGRVVLALILVALLGALAGCGSGGDGAATAAEVGETSANSSGKSSQSSFKATPIDIHALPLGDGKYKTNGAKRGYVYSCIANFGGGGAFEQGPWIDAAAGTWDLTEKIHVQGKVAWDSEFSQKVSGSKRKLQGNGLPPQPSGIFPVESSDPAYEYDRNPNTIAAYKLKASLPANPKRRSKPSCVGGTVGLMRNGVPLFSPFDAGGRDAVATEIQDRCNAHPEKTGQYHYHGLSGCLYTTKNRKRSVLLGWALDGFGIYAERDAEGTMLSSADLDACHGRTSKVSWNGKKRKMYHYVVTLDWPYTVACYRGKAITEADGLATGSPGGGIPEGAPPGGP